MKQEVTVELTGGKSITFETGKLAKQAGGSVVAKNGDNVVLATATANPDPREGIDFFPLTVDYREYTYAGGRIPRRFHQARRPSQRARNSHQPLRSIVPSGRCSRKVSVARPRSSPWSCRQTRRMIPMSLASMRASAALALSDIPFLGADRCRPRRHDRRTVHHEPHLRRTARRQIAA